MSLIADRQRTAKINKRASKHETENEKKLILFIILYFSPNGIPITNKQRYITLKLGLPCFTLRKLQKTLPTSDSGGLWNFPFRHHLLFWVFWFAPTRFLTFHRLLVSALLSGVVFEEDFEEGPRFLAASGSPLPHPHPFKHRLVKCAR